LNSRFTRIRRRIQQVQPVWWVWGGAAAAVAFVLSIDLQHPGESLCYSKQLLDLACPACGMGRAFNALLHVHLTRALAFNPLVLPAAFYVASLMVVSMFDALNGTRYTHKLLHIQFSKVAVLLAIVVLVLVWIRNLSLY